MVRVSAAVTSTLKVFTPAESATWKSALFRPESTSAVPLPSWISYVAPPSFTVGMMVTLSTPDAAGPA